MLTTKKKRRRRKMISEVRDMLISLIVVFISQCTYMSKLLIVRLKYAQFLIVKYSSVIKANAFCEYDVMQNEKRLGKKQSF